MLCDLVIDNFVTIRKYDNFQILLTMFDLRGWIHALILKLHLFILLNSFSYIKRVS